MSEWFKEHAWKSDLFTRADAPQDPPTHVRSISSRYNEVLRDEPVSDDVHRGLRGVCDTVLTQKLIPLPDVSPSTFPYASNCLTRAASCRCRERQCARHHEVRSSPAPSHRRPDRR